MGFDPLRFRTIIFAGLAFLLSGIDGVKAAEDWWHPSGKVSWDWQLTEPFSLERNVAMIDLDLFETSANSVARLKAKGIKTVCYLNAGAWENWREDAKHFPPDVLGNVYDTWPGERWLDIRRIKELAPLIGRRLDTCKAKGFDGVEPDNIDGYTNETGFPLNATDQLSFNRWLASEAHKRGLSIGLKNDPDQASALAADFDWALTEDCFSEGWCEQMLPFIQQGKAVFSAEYTDMNMTTETFCADAVPLGINAILKTRELDSWWEPCP